MGWGKTWPAHFFPTLTRLKINPVQKVIGWGKIVVHMVNCNCLRKTQPTLPCHEYTCNLCFFGGGEKLGQPPPDKVKQQPCSEGYRVGEYCRAFGKSSAEKHSQPYPVMNSHVTVAIKGVGKNWAGPFFPHPDKVKYQPHAEGYHVGKNSCSYG